MRRRRHRRYAEDLRRAVDCLPRGTRVAMLESLDDERIIVGAYTDGEGGMCPMLAAHRNGGRTNLASFAPPRGSYTHATTKRQARDPELRTPRALLEASPYYEGNPARLAEAAAEAHAPAQERGRGE